MTKHFTPAARPRGIQMVRADASSPAAILAEMNKAFEAFKDELNQELSDLKKGQEDVVRSEKIDRINTEITALQKSHDEASQMISALKIGGGGGDAMDPAKADHAKAFNAWFRKGDRALDADMRDLEIKAGLSTDSDPDGGYLVPEETASEIDRVATTVSVMREIATVMTIGGDDYKKLIGMGGAGAGWVGEKGSRPETDTPTLRELVFNLMELFANPAATQKTLDDARLDIAAWLGNEIEIKFAEQEGAAFISGDGVNKPRGILGYDTVANDSYAWGKVGFIASGKADGFLAPTTSVNPADCMIDTVFGLQQIYRNNASWLMSDATMGKVRKFKDADGNFIWAPPSGTAELSTILNKPVRTDDNMDAVAAGKFPIAFGDFRRAYLILDKFGIRVLRDPYTNKPYVHFYTTKRVGGGVQNFEAYKLIKIST